jgi:hypothetical protein
MTALDAKEPQRQRLRREARLIISIEARFRAFHFENPKVLETLIRLTQEAKAAGCTKIGCKALWERLRWDYMLETKSEDYRLNNDFTSRYVRLICSLRPDFVSLFEQRTLRAA